MSDRKISDLPEAWDPRETSETKIVWAAGVSLGRPPPLNEACCPFAYFALRDFSPVDLTPHELEALAGLCRRNPEVWEPCMLRVLEAEAAPSARNALPVRRLLAVLCPENERAIKQLASSAEFLKGFNQALHALDMGLLPYVCAMLCNMDGPTLARLATCLRCRVPTVDAELCFSSRAMYAAGATEREVFVESILKGAFPVDFIAAEALLNRTRATSAAAAPDVARLLSKAAERGWDPSTCARKTCAYVAAHAMCRADATNAEEVSRISEALCALREQEPAKLARICRVIVSGPDYRREALNLSRASALWHAMVELSVPEMEPARYEAAKSVTARKVATRNKVATQIKTIEEVFGVSRARRELTTLVIRVLEVQIKKLNARTAALRNMRRDRITEEEEEAREVRRLVAERIARAARAGKDEGAEKIYDDDALSVFSGDTEVASDYES